MARADDEVDPRRWDDVVCAVDAAVADDLARISSSRKLCERCVSGLRCWVITAVFIVVVVIMLLRMDGDYILLLPSCGAVVGIAIHTCFMIKVRTWLFVQAFLLQRSEGSQLSRFMSFSILDYLN